MSLRLVDTRPGSPYSTFPVVPGGPISYGLKTTDSGLSIEVGSLAASLGYSSVMNQGILPDQDPNLAKLGAIVQYQTTELRQPVSGSVPVSSSAPGILFAKADNSNNDKSVYAVQFPIQPDASIMAYFKFKIRTAWTLFSPDWLDLTNMTGMYFGLEHGTFNTACYFFLRNAVTGGSGVIGGPLQAFNTNRPSQTEISAFQWSTLADQTDVEVWIFFNTVGYPSPFPDPYVPVIEIWTRRTGVDTQPVLQETIPVGNFGTFQPLSDVSFPNVRAGPNGFATIYFGNAGKTGDNLQLDDWAFFPDYRPTINVGQAFPNSTIVVSPDCLVSYSASDNVTPDMEPISPWFPIADTSFVRPAINFIFQPDNSITPYALGVTQSTSAASGYYKTEPRLENGVEGGMIESFLYANEASLAPDSFGAGISIEDGTSAFKALLVQTETNVTSIGILKTYTDPSINGYYYPVDSNGNLLEIDWSSPRLVRLTLDKLRHKVTLYVDEVMVLEIPSTGTFPTSTVNYGRMAFGFLYPGLLSTGQCNFVDVNYSPRYKAYEVRDAVLPEHVGALTWTLNQNDTGGTAFNNFALSGTADITHGSANVTGSGTSFLSQVIPGQYLKNQTDPDTDYVKVLSVTSDTVLTLASTYGGTSGSTATAVVTDPDYLIITKMQFGALNTYIFYSRTDTFAEDGGFYVDFNSQVLNYTSSTGVGFASNIWTGGGVYVYLGNKVVQLVFVDCGPQGRFVGIVPGSGSIDDIINQTTLGKAFSTRVDWTQPTLFRLELRGFHSINLWAETTLQEPLISIPWQNNTQGFDLPADSTSPQIQFGHFDELSSSVMAWRYIRYGIGDGYEITMSQQFPNGLQPYLFGGKVFYKTTFDEN